ncbi:unnamed protein product [Arabidopsis thaliana]|uniref:Precursor of CEP2 n=2 Tax=Arabidopsis thaliana TaxID=3702 RepID=PCEP2_ARATH|nr:DNA-directed RNA polymerase II subunit RPB1-like protein [Arabidopsis thaliana]Q3ECM0.1 RecName: Full=Precursor of CEP2; Short=PCEP2; Contains: RecName: Full=C-terminally encoded peptide 2.1; Short=CEP2.1; Contains: RecName: Full=C-terminally encoded peptide 2.2; Short=CEP2.2; Flags: Precursor [Arabidopsis thaliana]ABE65412.1 hypothetical protein At1g59835 [Arabidopsis thaliana]AEE33625.1 DNA-directed RNA polymerase II subunit RPB1-like protein [Arabidopsis thaliana]VYS49486.1 unnamed protei|eukprot:NP_683452.1 DNA-directed RNA polymerase II subunit RPB1-like protein [Arabidopsis thaliana]
MKLFIITVVTILTISRVFDKTPATTEARKSKKMVGHEHFNEYLDPTFAGHTFGVVKEDFLEVKKLKKIGDENNLKNRFINEFAPTNPEDSLGIGHPRVLNNKFTNDFAPTNPGDSPGIRHPGVVNV